MSLIDPNLLQLIGLGSTGDPDIADGRHLRWIFNRILGFPRTGFRLRRRPSLLKINFESPPAGTPPIRSELTRKSELGTGARRRFPSGLTVSKTGGFVFGEAESGGQPLLRLDNKPVVLNLGVEGAPPPTSGEALSNPAAYVLLTIARRSRSGSVIARGYYDGRPTLRLVDRAAVGGDLRTTLTDLLSEITSVGNTLRVLSSADRLAGDGEVVRRDALSGAAIASRGLRPQSSRPGPFIDPNPFVTQTLLLHGGLLEHIDLRGRDASLLRVQWISARDLFVAEGWTEIQRFFLPLTNDPTIYPAWTTESGLKVANNRLRVAPPKRQPPWDREDGGDPSLLLDTAPSSVNHSLAARYLGVEFKQVDAAMREFLRGELQQVVPQSLVQVTERLEPEPGDDTGPEAMEWTVSPFDLLYGATADPEVACELGLATVDTTDPAGLYDYAVEAGFPTIWVQWLLQPEMGRDRAHQVREELGGELADWHRRGPFSPFSIASVITGLKRMPAVNLEPPPDLQAVVLPDPIRSPVQARVRLLWPRGATNLFESPGQTRVLHIFKRVTDAGDVLLHHRDDETKLLAPHLPTPYGVPERLNLIDRKLPSYGIHTWKVAAMDLFGRISPDALVSADVRDTIPPPPPGNMAAALLGDATTGPSWTKLVVAFDWLPSHERVAPDLAAFELNLRQGPLGTAETQQAATWGRLETTPGATAGAVRILWPSLAAGGVPLGLTLNVSTETLDEGGRRLTVELSPIACPFDSIGYARLAAAIRAFDSWGNASSFAVARAERVDLSVPPPQSFAADPLLATRPDAQNRSWFRLPLPAIAGASVRVLRASSVSLLSASGTDPVEFATMSVQEQVGLLRTLSVTHREPFATDHEQPLPATGGAYLMEFVGFDRGLTIATLAIENRTGTRSGWPSSPSPFMVIAVPRDAVPPAPLVRELRVSERTVTLSITPDVTGTTRSLAVYRARNSADASDVRRMKPVTEVTVSAANDPISVIDTGLYDEVDYFYRVVAISEGGLRSAPSGVLCARPIAQGPPPAPVVSSIERDPGSLARRMVRLLVPRRDYSVFLFRRPQFAPNWEAPTGPSIGIDGKLDLAVLASRSVASGYEVAIDDFVPAIDALYSYFARIEDPRGRVIAGPPLTEAP